MSAGGGLLSEELKGDSSGLGSRRRLKVSFSEELKYWDDCWLPNRSSCPKPGSREVSGRLEPNSTSAGTHTAHFDFSGP